MRRMSLLSRAGGFALLLLPLVTSTPGRAEEFVASPGRTTVETNKGRLVGALDDGIYSYLGVPYAKAERFMPARRSTLGKASGPPSPMAKTASSRR
jgi:para-nitrobenzyl esterase